jgi:hypothetical protein
MRLIGLIIMSLLVSHKAFSEDVISNCRDYYYGVCLNEISIKEFDSYLELHKDSDDESINGYQSIIWFLWADYYVNPFKKWRCFSQGVKELEQLIDSHTDNAELRFLRLTIQDNIPRFLGYHENREEDKAFIHKYLSEITDKDLQERIISYLSYNSMEKIK